MASVRRPPREWLSRHPALIDPSISALDIGVDTAVICSVEGFYPELLECLGLIASRSAPPCNGAEEGRIAKDFIVYKAGVGAPAQGMLMETLIASGVERFIVTGVAGSLTPKCCIGDIVIPTWGIREEGTSHHYLAADVVPRPSSSMVKELRRALRDENPMSGGIWSIDAPYRETKDKIKEYSRLGAVAIDMECTALMSIAMARKVKMVAVLAITDELSGPKWVQGFGSKKVSVARKAICESVASILKR